MDKFEPVHRIGKISDVIAEQIRNTILKGISKPGDKLPALSELGKLFQTSQLSVREAIKILEGEGLVKTKPGSGLFITEMNPIIISDRLSSILRVRKASINELAEARIVFEPIVSKLAAERITSEDLVRLEKNIQEASKSLESGLPAPLLNVEFHSLLAEATKNPVISLTMKTMFNVWQEWSSELPFQRERVRISKISIDFHWKILNALREKKSRKVQELVLQHALQIEKSFVKQSG